MSEQSQPTDEREEQGIQAIIFLQGMVDIEESREQARAGWRDMGEREKQFTLDFYNRMKNVRN